MIKTALQQFRRTLLFISLIGFTTIASCSKEAPVEEETIDANQLVELEETTEEIQITSEKLEEQLEELDSEIQ